MFSHFSLTFEADLTGAGYNLVALALGGSMQDNAAKAQYIKHVQRLWRVDLLGLCKQ